MTTYPLVSVLTPTYNHAQFIEPCLRSVLGQTYLNWEQVIIDDGSTDETAEIIARYKDPRIHYHYQENRGIFRLAETYNTALGLARGDLIAILEGDDLWPHNKLEVLVPLFDDQDIILACGAAKVVDSGGRETGIVGPSKRFLNTFPRSALFNDPVGLAAYVMLHAEGTAFATTCTILVRHSALEKIGGFQSVPGLPLTDYPTFLALSLEGKFAYVDHIMGYWRRHPAASSWLHREQIFEKIRAFALQFLSEHEAALQLTADQRREIVHSWYEKDFRFAFTRGRNLLLRKEWSQARLQFRKALGSPQPAVRIAAVVGCLASHFHCNLEPLFLLLDKEKRLATNLGKGGDA
jgi:glycosyltransferase involved in cell wall biosynthesis